MRLLQAQDPSGQAIPAISAGGYGNFHTNPTGAAGNARAIPTVRPFRFVKITTFSAELWLRFGLTSAVTVTAPSGEVLDGTAPLYIPAGPGSYDVFAFGDFKYIAMLCTGTVLLEYFE